MCEYLYNPDSRFVIFFSSGSCVCTRCRGSEALGLSNLFLLQHSRRHHCVFPLRIAVVGHHRVVRVDTALGDIVSACTSPCATTCCSRFPSATRKFVGRLLRIARNSLSRALSGITAPSPRTWASQGVEVISGARDSQSGQTRGRVAPSRHHHSHTLLITLFAKGVQQGTDSCQRRST